MLKINIGSLQSRVLLNKKGISQGINHCAKEILDKPTSVNEVLTFANNTTAKRNAFMVRMLYKYETANFYRKAAEKEDLSYVKNIFAFVKKPHREHFDLVERFGDSFEGLERIFVASENKREALNFAIDVDKQILNKHKKSRKELISELLESPYHKKYVKNFDRIKSYLILNNDNPKAVEWLDNMMSRNIFSQKHFDKRLQEKKIKEKFPFEASTKILNPNTFYSIYSEPVGNLASAACEYFNVSSEMLKNGNDKDIFNILSTTSSKNVNLRKSIIQSFTKRSKHDSSSAKSEYITELNNLFSTIDTDRYVRKFIKNTISILPYNLTIKELNEILAMVPSGKLESKRQAILDILRNNSKEQRMQILKENMSSVSDEGTLTKFFRIARNLFKKENKIDKLNNGASVSKKCVAKESQLKLILNGSQKEVENKSQQTLELAKESVKTKNPTPGISDKKQFVKDAVVGLVNRKLGVKTFEKQCDIYSANATKMRLNMLPEIFASIADTRKTDRAVGKLRSNSSNKDAITLFSKINGSNKKLVNYLLKKRNADNSRMFEIKDIITILDKAEARIAKDKKANPEYRARDARRYYNHLYEAKLEQYGKVKRQTFNA